LESSLGSIARPCLEREEERGGEARKERGGKERGEETVYSGRKYL
jgi:hypothetical protein